MESHRRYHKVYAFQLAVIYAPRLQLMKLTIVYVVITNLKTISPGHSIVQPLIYGVATDTCEQTAFCCQLLMQRPKGHN